MVDKFFFIFSTSAPLLPITKPGREVCIDTMHFLDVLSIITSDTPELTTFFFIYSLIL